MREILQKMLAQLGHQAVVIAENGQSLIQQCAMESPEVVITDNMMPDIFGLDAAAIIYERRPIPIILASSFCDRELALKAEQEHVLIYLVKPISLIHLETALARCRDWIMHPMPRENEVEELTEFRDGFGHPLNVMPRQARGTI